jgi:hypothetical protein
MPLQPMRDQRACPSAKARTVSMPLRSCQNGAKTGHVLDFPTWPRACPPLALAGGDNPIVRIPWHEVRTCSSANHACQGACPRLAATTGHVPRQVWGRSARRCSALQSSTQPGFPGLGGEARPGPVRTERFGRSGSDGAVRTERFGRSGSDGAGKARPEGAVRRLGPPRNRPPDQSLPPPKLVTCLTKLSHAAPGRAEARRYCGIHD